MGVAVGSGAAQVSYPDSHPAGARKGWEPQYKKQQLDIYFTNDTTTALPQPLYATDESGTGWKQSYVYGANDERISMSYLPSSDESSDWEPVAGESGVAPNTTPETLYYLEDSLDSVLALLNNDDEVALRYHYDAFGVATDAEKFDLNYPGPDNLFGYTGLGYDASSGLSYARARYFDSSIGRFISQDTYEGLIENPLSLNLYTYVENNPLRYTDPTGNMKWNQIDDLGKGIYDALANTVKGIFSWDTYKGLYDLGKALYNKTISLTELGKTVVGAAVEPYKYIVNNTTHVFGGKPTDKEVRKYGEKLGEVLLSFAGSAKAINLISKVAPSLSKVLNKLKKATCNCFTAGTKVLTDEGEKPIEEIEVGDRVLAKDDTTGEMAYKEVEWLFQRDVEETYNITVGGEIITTTDEHPFWIVGEGWVESKNLVVGNVLTTSDGKELAIEKIEVKKEHKTVYNFKVKDFHTYFVSNLEIWTHNKCNLGPGKVNFTSNGVKHVEDRHFGNKSGWEHKSKCTVTGGYWRTYSRDAIKNPDRVSMDGDRFVYEKEFNKVMGVDANGNNLYKVRVVVDKDGNLVTAFPQADWK